VGTSSAGNTGDPTSTTVSFSHDSGSTGSNRLLICGACRRSLTDITSITYNSVGLTKLAQNEGGDGGGSNGAEVWYLANPTTGSNTVLGTGANVRWGIGCMTLQGVNLSSPFGTPVTQGFNANSAAINVGSASGELVFSVMAKGNSDDTPSADAPQNQEWASVTTNATAANNIWCIASTKAGAGPTVSMDYSWDATTYQLDHVGVSIKAATRPRISLIMQGD
jgi:hypothetical protein